MQANQTIIALAAWYVLLTSAYNGFSITALKLTSAANRCVVGQSKVGIIWLFFLTYTGVGHETFVFGKLVGILLVVLGVVFFNQIFAFHGCAIRYLPVDTT